MMMKPAPAAPFVMREAKLLFQFTVIVLDTPAHLHCIDQRAKRYVTRQVREEVFCGFAFARWPLDEQPFLSPRFGTQGVAMGGTDPAGGEAR